MAGIALNRLNQAAVDPATFGVQFLPLDPGCVSDAIPAFFIGRNKDGFWVARDARGRIGGLFLSKSGALSLRTLAIGQVTPYVAGALFAAIALALALIPISPVFIERRLLSRSRASFSSCLQDYCCGLGFETTR